MSIDAGVLEQIALGVVPPGIAGVILFAALWWRQGGGDAARPASWRLVVLPVALAAFYTGFHAFLFGGLHVPPRQSTDWLPVASVIAAVAAIAFGLLSAPSTSGETSGKRGRKMARSAGPWLLVAAALAVIGWLAAGNLRTSWGVGEAAMHVGGFAGLALAASLGAERIAHRRPGPVSAVAMLVFAAGASQVLALGFHSLKFSQSAGLWAAFMGGAMVVALFRRGLSLARGGAVLVVAMVMAAMYQGVLFTMTPRAWVFAALVASSPAMAGLATFPAEGRGVRKALLTLGVAIVPIAVALGMALANAGGENEYGY